MTAATVAAPEEPRPAERGDAPPVPRWASLLWVLAALPVVVTTVRALARGWMPMGDNAYFSVRARDVLTDHHPLVGAWSSGSMAVGLDVNNLGPLQLDLLALPVRFDWVAGTAVGVAAVNVAAIALAALTARRVAGTPGMLVVAVAAAGLAWTLGELVYEPRQHHALVLPWFSYLVLVWALVCGDRRSLPWAVGVGSLVLQTHLSYALLVPALGVAGIVGLAVAWRRDRATRRGLFLDGGAALRRTVLIAAGVAVLCWSQTIVDQLAGRGNLGSVLAAGRAAQEPAGIANGARAVATVVASPLGWLPPSFRDFDPQDGLVSVGPAVAALVAVGALLVGAALLARRAGDRVSLAAVATAAVAVLVALVAAATQTGAGPFGLVAGNYRWLWPIAASTWLSLVLVAVRAAVRSDVARRPALVVVGGALAAVSVLALLPSSTADLVRSDEPLIPVARQLVGDLDALRGRGPLVVERTDLFFGEPYTYVLMAGLQDRGIEWEVSARVDVLRFGEGRAPSREATGVVWLVNGDDALEVGPDEERITVATGFSDAERRELRSLRDDPGERGDRLAELEARWRRETVAVKLRPVDPSDHRLWPSG